MRQFVQLMVASMGLLCASAGLAADPSRRSVVVLDQETAGASWSAPIHRAFRSTLTSGDAAPVEISWELTDLDRFNGSQYEHEQRSIDAVVITGSEMHDVLRRRRAEPGSDLLGLPLAEIPERVAAVLPQNAVILYAEPSQVAVGLDAASEAHGRVVKTADRPIVRDAESTIGLGGTGGYVLDPIAIGVIIAATLLQGTMILWLLIERRRRQTAELESRGRLREVIHLDRVAAIGAMSASIAHELNQPLGAIMANAETAELLLGAAPVDLNQLKEILSDIRQLDQHAGDIIAHLRRLLKRQSEPELHEFDLNEVVQRALRLLEPEARKKGVQVSIHQLQTALPVRVDQVHLEQVIMNLATNAMDAMQDCPPGTRRMMVETALATPSEIKVSVSDTGAGIPIDKLKSIFETFYTTKQQGTGLGLTVARTIVENFGGKIWAEGRPEGGAIFRFTLPLAKVRAT